MKMIHILQHVILLVLIASADLVSAVITPKAAFVVRQTGKIIKEQSHQLDVQPPFDHDSIKKQLHIAMVTTTTVAAIFASTFSFPNNAIAVGDIAQGETLFKDNCASCHVGGTNVVNEKRTLKNDALEKYIGGSNEESVKKFFTESLRHQKQVYFRMPGGHPTDENLDDLVSYIVDQAVSDKW
mmetsp:Transcript_34965/g.51123  ORF Transcript_34965/g.51123 Transcript_34965/m.51123 type:complete len:183 (-) Transcript_34965:74-622(-)